MRLASKGSLKIAAAILTTKGSLNLADNDCRQADVAYCGAGAAC